MRVSILMKWCMRGLAVLFIFPGLASAHDYKLGHLRMDHPYALIKTDPPSRLEVYFRAFKNDGSTLDRLVKVRTPIAGEALIRTETHTVDHEITWVPIDTLDVPAKGQVAMRHDTPEGYQILLTNLKRSVKVGDRFALTLSFEQSGEKEVMVWIQAPRKKVKGSVSTHKH